MYLGKRIMILGSSGSGKSTLALKLSQITGIPVVHLDRLLWNPGWVQTPQDEYGKKVNEAALEESWIIEGNNSKTLDFRLQRADCVIFLDFNRFFCIYRIFKRRIKNHGKTRPDMTEGCPEKIDLEYLRFVWNFPKRFRKTALEKACNSGKAFYHLKSRRQVAKFIEKARGLEGYDDGKRQT